ncbi:MAG: phospholipase C, phosphocholine-specific [Nevskiaceae bacterium]|nr:MAG: phospholipase C, phosphocholine-specific [Nevskiaceae bacterium]
MSELDRRQFLRLAGVAAAGAALPLSIQKALAIPANNRTGTIKDVEHVVILMQENRSFDHYFGTMKGVRGFGDRFPIPLAGGKPVWYQRDSQLKEVLPYYLDSSKGNAQRVSGTPHGWEDGHFAWNDGRYGLWPAIKESQSMSYYKEAELPFQFALANAFTLCDHYHCAMLTSTNPNRLFLWTGMNDPAGEHGGPVTSNQYDALGPSSEGYSWTTYPERLQEAGVSWKVYQFLPDNFTDNSLHGFVNYRLQNEAAGNNSDGSRSKPDGSTYFPAYDPALDAQYPLLKGCSNTMPDGGPDSPDLLASLRADVLAGKLPQVSWVVAPAAYSEHTGPSSPVQGGHYTQQVIEALTANPEVWSKTVLIVNFDENDGMFDHLPPPCAPSIGLDGQPIGGSTMDDSSERRGIGYLYDANWVYGPGIRVPCYVVSPWSRGGWVCSQVFDHTSVIQFLEKRFGVMEPNISAYRRAICGDLTSAFNFTNPNDEPFPALPEISKAEADALRAAQEQLAQLSNEATSLPVQEPGARPSRALPYELFVSASVGTGTVELRFDNTGAQGAVFHVYDKTNLLATPRRYAVEAGKSLTGTWVALGSYDLWVLGPNGFHRHFQGSALNLPTGGAPEIDVCYDSANGDVYVKLHNSGSATLSYQLVANAYFSSQPETVEVPAGASAERHWVLKAVGGWYDFTVSADNGFLRRFAGRVETGRHTISDPALGLI